MSYLEDRRHSYLEVREILASAINAKRSGSLLRIGDGESVILGYKPNLPNEDLSSHLHLWFGDTPPNSRQLLVLRDRLRLACRSATILGIPTLRQCNIHVRYKHSYQFLDQILRRRHKVIITDAAVHRFLHLSGDLLACLRGSPFIGLVTSQAIADLVSHYFIPDELFIKLIPGESPLESIESTSLSSKSWVDNCGFLKEFRINPPYRGAPYLVGAGLMGKLICDQIRRAGGFAIDIGSIFDCWAQVNSRAYFSSYPSHCYDLEHALHMSFLGSEERLHDFLSLATSHESAPESFRLQ